MCKKQCMLGCVVSENEKGSDVRTLQEDQQRN